MERTIYGLPCLSSATQVDRFDQQLANTFTINHNNIEEGRITNTSSAVALLVAFTACSTLTSRGVVESTRLHWYEYFSSCRSTLVEMKCAEALRLLCLRLITVNIISKPRRSFPLVSDGRSFTNVSNPLHAKSSTSGHGSCKRKYHAQAGTLEDENT